ncbi:hypothetical protein [Acinetobacter variabilis]|uniref:hypothetical protein n=1 Tax=Acinetobacter variabilis TaxID=70346 RepID=UPI00292A5157|nr:hypothetical protein [Acinetobacter variabilis]
MNGVGGRTIAEAKLSMTNAEVSQWAALRNKRGSLFTGRRIEQAIGALMALYAQNKVKEGVEISPYDYMPHEDEPELSFEEQRMQAIRKKAP